MRYISDVNDNTGLHSMGGLEPTNPTSRRESELKRRKRKEKRK